MLWIHKAIGDGFLVKFNDSYAAYNFGKTFLTRAPAASVTLLNSYDSIINQNTANTAPSIGYTPTVEVFMFSDNIGAPSATHGLLTVTPEIASLMTGYV